MELSTLISAFTIGLLGSAHCIGMCGGITSALSLSLKGRNPSHVAGLMLCYHSGRIFSYALAGALLAGIGWYLGDLAPAVKMALRYFAAGMMIAMGFYLTGWWRGLTVLEQLGQILWKRLQPLSKKLLPITHSGSALLLGMVWGWLPCGLVYSNLALAASQGSILSGSLVMICFGLGTLPAVFLTGLFSRQIHHIIQASLTRNIAGLMVILFGLWATPGKHQMWIMSLF
ncbi:cytochrome biogenesis protein [Endozoicomonas sp. (ex Bugula neritina AB1)]|nr:cytochrome biogenesis protein [Endozoicomonas sp. (ex Bugula neritina AB1)]